MIIILLAGLVLGIGVFLLVKGQMDKSSKD